MMSRPCRGWCCVGDQVLLSSDSKCGIPACRVVRRGSIVDDVVAFSADGDAGAGGEGDFGIPKGDVLARLDGESRIHLEGGTGIAAVGMPQPCRLDPLQGHILALLKDDRPAGGFQVDQVDVLDILDLEDVEASLEFDVHCIGVLPRFDVNRQRLRSFIIVEFPRRIDFVPSSEQEEEAPVSMVEPGGRSSFPIVMIVLTGACGVVFGIVVSDDIDAHDEYLTLKGTKDRSVQ